MSPTPKTTRELLAHMEQSVMFTAARPPVVMERGEGSYLWDVEGGRYLDFIQGWAVNCLGHSPPVIQKALARQAAVLVNASPAYYNPQWIEFAGLLTKTSGLDKVFFANTGAEANEGALKMARKYGMRHLKGAYGVVTAWNSFHGRTLAMMSATGKGVWEGLFEPKVPGFTHVPFNDLEAMRLAVTNKVCAVMVEPVQGEGGVFPATVEYLRGLRKLCDETGVLLIFDEVQTAIGRLGHLYGFQHYGVQPDIMTLGKGLGGGFPVSAVVAREKACLFDIGEQGGTFNAQPLAMAVGKAVVEEVIHKNLCAHAARMGGRLMDKLKEMGREFGFADIRGMGLLVGVDLPQSEIPPGPAQPSAPTIGHQVVQECLKAGLLINSPRPATLRFMPALTVTETEIDEMVDILRGCLQRVL
ncbi:MAG: acetylornithine transaminase [Deltaproteobacteria bacterium]|nr:acetylornithine transaminase [Deltaproteobacteria bacterium]